jgi:hypothetical protein
MALWAMYLMRCEHGWVYVAHMASHGGGSVFASITTIHLLLWGPTLCPARFSSSRNDNGCTTSKSMWKSICMTLVYYLITTGTRRLLILY